MAEGTPGQLRKVETAADVRREAAQLANQAARDMVRLSEWLTIVKAGKQPQGVSGLTQRSVRESHARASAEYHAYDRIVRFIDTGVVLKEDGE